MRLETERKEKETIKKAAEAARMELETERKEKEDLMFELQMLRAQRPCK